MLRNNYVLTVAKLLVRATSSLIEAGKIISADDIKIS
jgi:hypothetical protein